MEIEKITREFFKRRFPDKKIEFEKKCGYFQQWEKRLSSENPEEYMDYISKKVWEELKKEVLK